MRPRIAIATFGALAVIASLGACSSNKGTDTSSSSDSKKQSGAIATDPKDSQGPAKEISGASKGGTINILQEDDYEHLDPQRTYVVQAFAIEQLFSRTLTSFKEDGSGKLLLVGDLATDAGTDVNKDCKTWKYTLKSGLKFEDGSPITAKDVAYGIARSFSPNLSEGPHYIQQWLAGDVTYNKSYKGPYDGAPTTPPNLEVSGDNGLTFKFNSPHCDLPFAATMSTAPVPQAKDTKVDYDNRPFASGPYKIKKYTRGTSLELERNQYWDAKTDPLRHAYPDTYMVTFGPDDQQQAERVLADNGVDQTAIAQAPVPQQVLPSVLSNSSAMKRATQGTTPFVYYLAVNVQRVPDLNVRKALSYAVDRGGLIQLLGGPPAGEPATTMLSPATIGYKKYDAFPAGANGNPEKAKELLGNKRVKLTFGFRNNAQGQKIAPFMKESLGKAGFDIALQPVDAGNYFSLLGRKANPWDFYLTDWAADWPSGAAVLPPLFDGRAFADEGNIDTSYFDNPGIDSEMDEISKLPVSEAASKWAALDEKVTSTYAATVPMYYKKSLSLNGSKVGGVVLSDSLGTQIFYNTYVKK